MSELNVLDELGIRRATDKSSLEHDYLTRYERLFMPFRDESINLMEIGVFDGASLHLWEDYFPRANIIGIDIDARCKQFEGGRRIVQIASQSDPAALRAIAARHRPDILIDDGSHQADHILISFRTIYPMLSPGGLYVVEDLGMHSGATAAMYRGTAEMPPQEYFLRLANRVVYPSDEAEPEPGLASATDAVEFFQSVAVIRKKKKPDPDRVEIRRRVVGELNSHRNWGWFSQYLTNHGGSADEAVACAQRAAEMAPQEIAHLVELSGALERAGRLDDAIAAAKEAAKRAPGHPFFPMVVKRLMDKQGQAEVLSANQFPAPPPKSPRID